MTCRYRVRLFVVLVALFAPLVGAREVGAEPGRARTAFAVVIGNNHSLGSRRPDLHYADDDAAKYFAILQTITEDRISLLTEFDSDSARLFPDARARAARPVRSELLRAGRELAERVKTAADAGAETELYLVFAGHGDVDGGMGFIELADARFTSADLEAWLRAIPFSRAHVILDSCNSFFMLGARKPGGRFYATSEDVARSLAARLPNVGVFLSTSAEGESFEWSEIQSGIFSHVVRSGLLGAADADGDGAVSYLELAAFVTTATADVKNPNMRPHVFARGPAGHSEEPIVAPGSRVGARTLRLVDPTTMRVRLRNRDALPLLDAHEEPGRPLTITLPEEWAEDAVIERSLPPDGARSPQIFAVPPATSEMSLASLQPVVARGVSRGPAEIFQTLFARPFGPRAFAAYVEQARSEAPEVYGVSREDAERMDLLLGQIESAEHDQRQVTGYGLLGLGALYGVVGGSYLYFGDRLNDTQRSGANVLGGTFLGLAALSVGYGAYTLSAPWSGEQAARDYHAALGSGTDYARAFAAAEARIRELAAREASRRSAGRVFGGAALAVSLAALTYNEFQATTAQERVNGRLFAGTGALLGASLLAYHSLIHSPVERLMTVWNRDPGMLHIQPAVVPAQGGVILGVVGRF